MRNIDEANVDQYIEELSNRTKGKYITQGVSFNKNCKRQMKLLRQALLESSSFSGLIKEMLALNFHQGNVNHIPAQPINITPNEKQVRELPIKEEKVKSSLQPKKESIVKKNASGWV